MFMRIVQQVNGLIMAQYIRASMWVKALVLPNVNKLRVNIILASLSVGNLFNRLVKTVLNIRALVVNRITLDPSINQEPISAKHLATQLGLQPQTIVPPTSQPVVTAQSRKTAKHAASTKSGRSRSKGNKTAQIRTVPQSIQAGTKLEGLVKQHLQHANQTHKQGK
jgi:hypothetical protein